MPTPPYYHAHSLAEAGASNLKIPPGRVAQLARAPRLHRGGRPFESGRAHMIRIAVIGAGPAGFYTAGHLLKDGPETLEVDMFERLPTPWGLVRSGVAPDHPKIKSVTRIYEKTAAHPRFRFFGNVELGRDVSREELAEHYHAIVYATGSPADRPLGIPGEELQGSHPATDFVGWYNGHPDYTDHDFDLSATRAVVIGNGNVALDVARMLTLSHDELARTDIADHALELLDASSVSEITVVGRRGPAQAAFTNPELLELGELEEADVVVDPEELERALAVEDPNADPTSKRNVAVLREYAKRPLANKRKRIILRFLLSPLEFLGMGGAFEPPPWRAMHYRPLRTAGSEPCRRARRRASRRGSC